MKIPCWKMLMRFLLASSVVFFVASQGLSYRHLWQDEVETAERAKSILAYGVPKTIDPKGEWSLNVGGTEIEESDLHRYTPWFQFYVAAAGLKAGKLFGLDQDVSARIPFVFLHSLSSGMVAAALTPALGLSSWISVPVGVLYGMNSVRLIHARSARYHALTDFLFLLAWIAFGIRGCFPIAQGVLVASLILSFFTHTLFGTLAVSLLMALLILSEPRRKSTWISLLCTGIGTLAIAGLLRPWEQSKIWGHFSFGPFRSLGNWSELSFVFPFFILSVVLVYFFRDKKVSKLDPTSTRNPIHFLFLAASLLTLTIIGVRLLDFHPYSQMRYYLPIVGTFLFWPLGLAYRTPSLWNRRTRFIYVSLLITFLLLPEVSRNIRYFKGLQIVKFDQHAAGLLSQGDLSYEQPLDSAFTLIRDKGKPGEAVYVDYVPQFVNWYLPDFVPALVPDSATLSHLGKLNPRTSLPNHLPDWYLTFPQSMNGFLTCGGRCEYEIVRNSPLDESFVIKSKRTGNEIVFCRVASWTTSHWNNSPALAYFNEYRSPKGIQAEPLVLARRCDTSGVSRSKKAGP